MSWSLYTSSPFFALVVRPSLSTTVVKHHQMIPLTLRRALSFDTLTHKVQDTNGSLIFPYSVLQAYDLLEMIRVLWQWHFGFCGWSRSFCQCATFTFTAGEFPVPTIRLPWIIIDSKILVLPEFV